VSDLARPRIQLHFCVATETQAAELSAAWEEIVTSRLGRFLAGVYNGNEFHFDLTDLRALDTELANACIDYLNYDRLGKAEVHTHLPDGGRQMEWFRPLVHARLLSDSVPA
jgi:hypothetical protein